MKRSHRVNAMALAGITAAAVVIAGCSSGGSTSSSSSSSALTASAPGITANQILIGSHQPLTGVAAPGYDEIAPASNAYFQYVNAHGGIYGRKIVYKYLNDQYDPTITSTVVHQLVLQDNVYAIFDGLGTPTHLAVVKYLNSSKIPDVFVASGCDCWNAPSTCRTRPAGRSTTSARARSSGTTSSSTSRARRSATSTRTTSSAWTASRAWTTRSRSPRSWPGRATTRRSPTWPRR